MLIILAFFAASVISQDSNSDRNQSAGFAGTCDYRIVEESKYSSFDVSALGLTSSKSICMNGYYSGADGRSQSIEVFVAESEAHIRKLAVTEMIPRVRNGVNSTNMIILDIERPVDWKLLARGCADCWNDTLATAVADALAMRIKVVQSIFPHATVGLYGITKSSASIDGYVRAASLGAFDTLDYIVPVLYLGPGMNATLHTHDVLTSASTLRTRKGRAIPMAPVISWIFFGSGNKSRCAVPAAETHAIIDVIETLNSRLSPRRQLLPIPVVSFWFGSDNDTVNRTHCDEVDPLKWLTEGRYVPARCLPPAPG
jgi:hypothetical protein